MPFILPDSTITLYKGVEISSTQQVVFSSRANQNAYYAKRVLASNVKCTYVRKGRPIKVAIPSRIVNQANFISFTNPSFENVTFYARIMDWEYVNNQTTKITFAVDFFQSYMFDISCIRSFILRQHQSESDRTICNLNPWINNVYDMLTVEDQIQVSPDIMDDSDYRLTSDDYFHPSFGNEYCVMQIAQWADAEVLPKWKEVLEANSVLTIYADGNVYRDPDETFPPVSGDYRPPLIRPFDIVVIKRGEVDADGRDRSYYYLSQIVNYLTEKRVTMEILGIYFIPVDYFTSWLKTGEMNTISVPRPDKTGITNVKLLRFPYNYLQVVCNGVIKEYRYEYFTGDSAEDLQFTYALSLDSAPQATLAPLNYRAINNPTETIKTKANFDERFDIPEIPQVAYTTDAYLSYVSACLAEQMGSYSASTFKDLTHEPGFFGNIANYLEGKPYGSERVNSVRGSGAGAFLSNMIEVLSAGINGSTFEQREAENRLPRAKAEAEILRDYSLDRMDITSENIKEVYGSQKQMYANDVYTPGAGSMLTKYIGRNINPMTPYFVNKHMRQEFIKVADDLLSLYGYAQNKNAIPYLFNYIAGSTTATEVPIFINNITYVKTSSITIEAPTEQISGYFEDIFNSGHFFLKGDGR